MAKRYTQAERQRYILGWKTTALGKLAYCRQQRISKTTLNGWLKQENSAIKSEKATFIPAKVKDSEERITVRLPGQLSINCLINQLPEVIRVLQTC